MDPLIGGIRWIFQVFLPSPETGAAIRHGGLDTASMPWRTDQNRQRQTETDGRSERDMLGV